MRETLFLCQIKFRRFSSQIYQTDIDKYIRHFIITQFLQVNSFFIWSREMVKYWYMSQSVQWEYMLQLTYTFVSQKKAGFQLSCVLSLQRLKDLNFKKLGEFRDKLNLTVYIQNSDRTTIIKQFMAWNTKKLIFGA